MVELLNILKNQADIIYNSRISLVHIGFVFIQLEYFIENESVSREDDLHPIIGYNRAD